MSKNYDVIIAGCGAAGLYAAINLPKELNILIICKRDLPLCNSSLAQGGIAGVYNSPTDNIQYHQNDTLIAGSFKNNVEAVHTLVSEAAQDIEHIIELGVEFDKNPDGTYHRTLEGGHSHHRIFHHADATGKEITSTLLENVQQLRNVTIMENTMMCSVKQTKTGYSALLKLADDSYETCNCHFMIMATGGIGRVYQFTTNSAIATGDGITFAYEMGAKIKNLSYVQFHPTAFNNRATIILESRKQNSTDFYLDISYKDSEFLKKRFPMIYQNLLEQGYDMTKEPVPIFPCQHYLMGGIDVDNNSETSLPNLYACGECSHTGVHGSNRLASNSLLEALVFSRHAANSIASRLADAPKDFEEAEFDPHIGAPRIPKGVRTETRKILQNCYFVIPDKKAAAAGFKRVKEIREDLLSGGYFVDADFVLAKSIVTVAYIILGEVMQ